MAMVKQAPAQLPTYKDVVHSVKLYGIIKSGEGRDKGMHVLLEEETLTLFSLSRGFKTYTYIT